MCEYYQSKCCGVYCFMYSSGTWVMNSVHPQMAAVIQDKLQSRSGFKNFRFEPKRFKKDKLPYVVWKEVLATHRVCCKGLGN